MRALRFGALLAVTVLTGMGPVAAGARPVPAAVDVEEDCAERSPATYSTEVAQGTAGHLDLDALFLLDGIRRADAERVVARAAESYAPLEITVVPRLRKLSFAGDAGGASAPVDDLMAAAKQAVGGERPAGIDVVHVLTRKDIYLQPNDGLNGMADCLGGVRYPSRAFSVSELFVVDEPGSERGDGHGAMITAHEIGHLLGGHHEYANCAEGPAPSVCTLMFPYYLGNFGPGLGVPVNSQTFGTLEAAVVRGYTEDFAAP